MEYGQSMKANYQEYGQPMKLCFLYDFAFWVLKRCIHVKFFTGEVRVNMTFVKPEKKKKKKRELDLFRACQWVGVMQTWARIKRRVSLSISLSCHLKEEVAGRRGKWMCPQRSPPLSSLLHSAPELTFASYSYYYYLSFSLHPSLMFFFFLLSSFL